MNRSHPHKTRLIPFAFSTHIYRIVIDYLLAQIYSLNTHALERLSLYSMVHG